MTSDAETIIHMRRTLFGIGLMFPGFSVLRRTSNNRVSDIARDRSELSC